MNKYATMLKDQWTQADPEMVASLEDPETYFSQLGEQAAEQVADLSLNLAGPDKPGEEYLEKVGRLRRSSSRSCNPRATWTRTNRRSRRTSRAAARRNRKPGSGKHTSTIRKAWKFS